MLGDDVDARGAPEARDHADPEAAVGSGHHQRTLLVLLAAQHSVRAPHLGQHQISKAHHFIGDVAGAGESAQRLADRAKIVMIQAKKRVALNCSLALLKCSIARPHIH